LSFDELSSLLDRMIRTGHFERATLVRPVSYLPRATFEAMNASQLASKIYIQLGQRATHDSISYPEFVASLASLNIARHETVWCVNLLRNLFERNLIL
jgi:hypothetical protein